MILVVVFQQRHVDHCEGGSPCIPAVTCRFSSLDLPCLLDHYHTNTVIYDLLHIPYRIQVQAQ